ncbi:MAG: flagellin hook IN motif-containing protein, partial [Comamonas sp.]
IGTGTEPVELGPIAKANSSQERAGQIVSAINAKSADTGVTAFLNQGADGSLSIDLRSSNVEQKTTTDNSVTPSKTTTETVA